MINNYIKKENVTESSKIITRFGGADKIEAALMKCAWDGVYCWETEKWYSARYWQYHKMSVKYTGITMWELYWLKKQVN
ncbi:hypothetical protein JH040_000027 [Acinetobacter baumannii]|nr:hypothetical protein [Acinetobacter baumannii]EKX3627677.1 hypothetical protein [Acinetobacter baumannii]